MQKSPPPFIWASPDEKNILDCESLYCTWSPQKLRSLHGRVGMFNGELTLPVGHFIIVGSLLQPQLSSYSSSAGSFSRDERTKNHC